MQAPRVYLETSFFGHLAGREHPNAVINARQRLTREWWNTQRGSFRPVISMAVIAEAKAGDPQAAQERLEYIQGLSILEQSPGVRGLAGVILADSSMPQKAEMDALHVAIAAYHGIEYLATWNMKHIANAMIRRDVETVLRANGFQPPVICTPEELFQNE